MDGLLSYILSKKYTDKSILGISGVLSGKNCTINSATKVDGITTIVFKWTADNGIVRTTQIQVADGETPTIEITPITGGNRVTFTLDGVPQSFDVMDGEDGISVTDADVNASNHLIITLSDGTTIDAGEITTVSELSGLDDVELTTLSDGDSLVYDAASQKWTNKELSYEYAVEDLTDVDIDTTTLVDGDIIKWDATNSKWVKGQIPTIEHIDDIEDVTVTTPTDGQILVYDNGVWKNTDNEVVADINDLGDVEIDTTTLENGQILKYDEVRGVWYNGNASAVSTKVEDLADVSIDPATFEDGQVLVWDATNEVWVNKNNGANIQKLDDIGDVDLTSLVDGQIIVWDATAQKWINAELITTLANLSDVALANLQDNDILRFDSATNKWYNTITDTIVTENSANLVSSGAVFTAIKVVDDKIGALANLKTTDKTTVVNAMNEVFDSLADLIVKVGDLTLLATTDKTTIVNAINEIATNVGDLTTLTTTDKTTIVNAINEVLATVKGLKYLEQLSTMVEAGDYPNRVVHYIGATGAGYTRGYIYRSTPSVVEGEVVYNWVRLDVQPNNDDYETLSNKPQINDVELVGNKSLDDLRINGKFQYAVLPVADNTLVGKIVEYTGGSTADLKTGYFYRCQYVSENDDYEWIQLDVSSNAELAQRITTLETNQGDMTQLTIPSVTDLVGAINVLAIRGIKSITYSEPYLTITLQDDSTFSFDITIVLNSTGLNDLGDTILDTIQDTNLIKYDSSINKYVPYDVVTALTNTLQSSKDYTDQEILKINTAEAIVVDAKPTYDASTNTVVYYKDGQVHVSDKPETRFYYTDSVSGDSFCVSWIDGTEFEYNVAQVDYDDFVSKTNDVVSTYTTDMVDKDKIPNISAMDALYAIVATALALKVNTSDIIDNLLSDDGTVPLSAAQGKVLNLKFDDKQDIIQYSTMIPVTAQMVTDNMVVQYIGADSQAYLKGRWYEASYDSAQDIYYWKEVKFSADYDSTIIQNSTNAPQGGAVYTELQLKQDKNLETPIVVEGTQELTVETALNELNTAKAKKFQVTTMPVASIDNLGLVVQYISATTSSYTEGYFYKCKVIPNTDPVEYGWEALTSKIDVDSTLSNTSTNPAENQAITNAVQALQNGVIIVYPTEADRLDEVDFSAGNIVAIGSICYCVAEESWYRVTAINASSLAVTWTAYDPKIATDTDVEKRLEKVTALPTASVANLGEILLLTSAQTGYEAGGIYRCVSDGEATPTYSWELISMSPLEFDTDDFNVVNDTVSLNPNQRIFKDTKEVWEALTLTEKAKYTVVIFTNDNTSHGSSGGQGTTNYNDLTNKPSINGVALTGNKTLTNLGAQGSTLTTPIVLGGTSYTTVESLLTAMATIINNSAYWQ